jgi:O-methyltransferase
MITNETAKPTIPGPTKQWLWRHVPGLRPSLVYLAYCVVSKVPVERCPALWAKLIEIKVPRGVRPKPIKSPEGGANINILFQLLRRTADVKGDIAECGVFRGASLLATGLFVKQHAWKKNVLGFDSFEGFGDSIQFDLQLGGQQSDDKKVGGFGNTSYEVIQRKTARLGIDRTVHLCKGFFSNTLPAVFDRQFSFVHLDCDIYQSYKECLEFFFPRLSPGGIILFDEYNDPPWPGCNLAVDEFFRDESECPIEIESDNYQKWYICKNGTSS